MANKIKYCGRWRIDQYSQWQIRYFDTLDDLQQYWRGFHSILAPKCIKESYKITYESLDVHGKEKYFGFNESSCK